MRPKMNILRHMIAALTLVLVCAGVPLLGQKAPGKPISLSLDKLSDQHPQNVKTELDKYNGRIALRVIDTTPADVADGIHLGIFDTPEFKDGTTEVQVAGEP